MPLGLSVAALMLADAAAQPAYGPSLPPVKRVEAPPAPADRCPPPDLSGDVHEIIVCAPRPQGYRLDPDVMEARREMRSGGPPRRPERAQPSQCGTVGPMGCTGRPTIDFLSTALVLGQMARKAAKGENVGQMFVTTPTRSEYQLYLDAKRRREAIEESEQAAGKSAAAVARAKADPSPVPEPEH